MKNALGIEVIRPNDVLVIMRGIPGSGKSTTAKRIVGNGVIHSTDDIIEAQGDYNEFFANMIANKDFTPLSQAHSQNFKNAKASMDSGISPVVIDNTNIKANEPKNYIEYALKLGYADENIEFVEVGTGGLSAEELAQRNTHGVPLDKINMMIQSMESVGPLTLQKVMDAKPMYSNKPKLFASVVLDDNSQQKLVTALRHYIPEGWEIIAHHMTINFGKGLGPDRIDDLGKTVNLVASEIGISDMAIAVKVHGYPSDNNIPHVTLAINKAGGAKPVMSNDITKWTKMNSHINLRGTVTEQKLG
jgi:predicted kinase